MNLQKALQQQKEQQKKEDKNKKEDKKPKDDKKQKEKEKPKEDEKNEQPKPQPSKLTKQDAEEKLKAYCNRKKTCRINYEGLILLHHQSQKKIGNIYGLTFPFDHANC